MKLWKNKQFWGVLIAIVLLAWCFKDVRWSTVRTLSEQINYVYLLPLMVFAFLFVFLRAIRWRLMISQQRQLPWSRAIGLYSAGQVLNIVMPALTGQVGRVILFSRKVGIRKTFVFSTIVLEVLFDAISLMAFLLMTSLAFAIPTEYGSAGLILGSATILLLIVLYLILHFQHRIEDFGRRVFRDSRPGVYIGIKKFLRSFTKGIELLRSSQNLLASVSISLLSWLVHVLAIYFLFQSFGMDLPFAAASVVMIVNTIALMIPITPGNAGTFEVAVSTSLLAFGVSRPDAVLFALALHISDLIPMFALGYLYLHTERISLREIKERHADRDILDRVDEEGSFVEEEERV